MTADINEEMKDVLSRLEAIFVPGRLCDRRDEMRLLRETGHTMLFAGGVKWSVLLPDFDKKLRGESESLDAAFDDMSNCLSFLAQDHGDDTRVVCSVEVSATDNAVTQVLQ
ncbi:MAG: hypothetical protein ACAH83_11555 [Alphaproteobacteria bacterium]